MNFFYVKLSCPKDVNDTSFHDLLLKINSKDLEQNLLTNIPNSLNKANKGDIIILHIGGDASKKRKYLKENTLLGVDFYENGIKAICAVESVNEIKKEVVVNFVGLEDTINKNDLYIYPQFINHIGGTTKGVPNQAGLYELPQDVGLSFLDYLSQKELIPNKANFLDGIYFNGYLLEVGASLYKEQFANQLNDSFIKELVDDSEPIESLTNINHTSYDFFSPITFYESLKKNNLIYENLFINRYLASLMTKPFVLLSGLAGSGKTKLAQSFAQWICADESQYSIVAVGADWTNREPLLGYVDALDSSKYIKPENGALQVIINANNNPDKPHFLILDEMNLSHVERYFADFLSVMESKDDFKLHSSKNDLSEVPAKLSWPENLMVIGTVNIDETTYMFSPKVLDRANVLEFRVDADNLETFLEKNLDIGDFDREGASMGLSFLEMKNKKFENGVDKNLNSELIKFFEELQKIGAEFGYRTAKEIKRLYVQLGELGTTDKNDRIDVAILQKLLPKVHGSRRKLMPFLEKMAVLCVVDTTKDAKEIFKEIEGRKMKMDKDSVKYPLSLEKITRMYRAAQANGFASFAEA